jgi:hypothetical protein
LRAPRVTGFWRLIIAALVPRAVTTKHQKLKGELLSDDGVKNEEKDKKTIFNAQLDKVGFIEAQGLPWGRVLR